MARGATVYKVGLSLADMDRSVYRDDELTLALHPSENEERLALKLAVYAWHASDELAFAQGLTDPEQPELWERSLTGDIVTWIDLGQPDEKSVLRACGRARQVVVYHCRTNAALWWEPLAPKVARAKNLVAYHVDPEQVAALSKLVGRTMEFSVTTQDGETWFRTDAGEALVTRTRLT